MMLCARQVAATSARLFGATSARRVAGHRPRMAIVAAARTIHTDRRRWWTHLIHGRLLWWCYQTAKRAFQYATPVRPNPHLLFCGMAVFLWDRERIPVEDVVRCLDEYEKRLHWDPRAKQKTIAPGTASGQKGETSGGGNQTGAPSSVSEYPEEGVASEEEEERLSKPEMSHGEVNGLGTGMFDGDDDSDSEDGLGTPSGSSDIHEMDCDRGLGTSVVELVPVIDEDDPVDDHTPGITCFTSGDVEVSKEQLLRVYEAELGVDLGTTTTNSPDRFHDGTSGVGGAQANHTSELTETTSVANDATDVVQRPASSEGPGETDYAPLRDGTNHTPLQDPLSGWELMSEQENCKLYKAPYGDTGLNKYKVIGAYDDITAKDFLDIQVDHNARKEWDSYIVKLDTIDTDPASGCDVIHWIMKYPFPMQNREYVYVRKHWVNRTENAIVLINRSVTHPKVPESRRNVRVHRYFSEMVIKPYTFIDDLGFGFELTYFDDPQSYLPSSCVNWVTTTAMPDFLNQIHNAALNRIAGDVKKHSIGA